MDILKKREAAVNARRRFETEYGGKEMSEKKRRVTLGKIYKEELSKMKS